MQSPLRITWHECDHSAAVEGHIRDYVAKLDKVYDKITSCDVAVELPHRHKHQGKHFKVRIHINVPNDEIIVSRDPAEHSENEDPYVAVHEAFKTATRLLRDYKGKHYESRRRR